ncbi:MAG: glycosyltransferase family 39 protein [Acidobacteriia bacterium]|nr:glycosyltransferase family 39 protein [Terriglobia bacterium]
MGSDRPEQEERPRGNDGDLPWRAFAAIAACFVVLSLSSNLLFPPFDGPDEHSHFHYARLLAQGRGLPVQTDPERTADTEGFGPPLYYLVPAAILRVADPERGAAISHIGVVSFKELARMASRGGTLPAMNPLWLGFPRGTEPNLFVHPEGGPLAPGPLRSVHWMRVFSTLCGLTTLAGLHLLAREAAPGRRCAQIVALSVVAFNPQFVYLSGLLNNDNLVTAFATLALWRTAAVLRSERAGRLDVALLGAFLGLGMLAKPNMMFLSIPVAVVLWRRSPGFRAFSRDLALLAAIAVGIAGWFYVRNAWIYGGLDFFGWKTRSMIHPIFVLPPGLRWEYLSRKLAPILFTSFWGRFGWLTLRLPLGQYLFYGLLSLTSLATLLPHGVGDASGAGRPTLALLWAAATLNLASLLAFDLLFWAEQGRLLYPSIGASATLIGLGIERSLALGSGSSRRAVAFALPALLLASVVFAQWVVIRPVYFR